MHGCANLRLAPVPPTPPAIAIAHPFLYIPPSLLYLLHSLSALFILLKRSSALAARAVDARPVAFCVPRPAPTVPAVHAQAVASSLLPLPLDGNCVWSEFGGALRCTDDDVCLSLRRAPSTSPCDVRLAAEPSLRSPAAASPLLFPSPLPLPDTIPSPFPSTLVTVPSHPLTPKIEPIPPPRSEKIPRPY